MKTPEEKRAAAKERASRRAAEGKQFPYAWLGSGGMSLSLNPRDKYWIGITASDAHGVTVTGSLWLGDPNQLGEFIRALIARYNALVEEVNAVAAQCAMDQLNLIEEKRG